MVEYRKKKKKKSKQKPKNENEEKTEHQTQTQDNEKKTSNFQSKLENHIKYHQQQTSYILDFITYITKQK